MSSDKVPPVGKDVFALIPILLPISILSLAGGFSSLYKTVESDQPRYGYVVGASESKGSRSNNTTIAILDNRGNLKEYSIKSSLKISEIPKIRARVRAASKKKVEYITYNDGRGLLSLKLMNGDVLLSEQHVLSANKFSGWSMTILGFLMLVGSAILMANLPVDEEEH